MGMLITWALSAFQPNSVRIVGVKDAMEAAVISQQKNIKELDHVSGNIRFLRQTNLRKPDLPVGEDFKPIHTFERYLLVAFIAP